MSPAIVTNQTLSLEVECQMVRVSTAEQWITMPKIREACDGCGNPDCPDLHLCDVQMPVGPPKRTTAPIEEWEREYRREYLGEQVSVPDEVKADACSIWTMAETPSFKNRYSGREAVTMLLKYGLDLTGVAQVLGVTPDRICRKFSRSDHDASKWLKVEDMLRAGAESYADVAAITGIDAGSIQRMAELLGLQSKTAARRAAGGGLKYTAEQRAQARAMRAEGKRFNEIARETGIGYHAVVGMFRRR